MNGGGANNVTNLQVSLLDFTAVDKTKTNQFRIRNETTIEVIRAHRSAPSIIRERKLALMTAAAR